MKSYIIGFLLSFLISVIIAPLIILIIKKLKAGQNILGYVENHKSKQGTPTFGGLIFIISTLITYLFFIGNNEKFMIVILLTMLGYGTIGFLDDFIKVKLKHNEGLKPYQKVIGQVGIAFIISLFIYNSKLLGGEIFIPYSNITFNIGAFIIPFVIIVFIAVTNSVNLTDGLDGLAGIVSFLYLFGFSIILNIYIIHLENIGEGLEIIDELKNVLILNGIFMGGILGFLCFNLNPAKIFMGDTGSLAIGGYIASASALTKFYLLIPLLGFLFVLSSISVIIQVLYYKRTKKRIFLMAPIHHHFERKGIKENKIVSTYAIITLIISMISILLYMELYYVI